MQPFSYSACPAPVAGRSTPPAAVPALKRALVRMAITAAAVVGLPVAIAGGIWAHSQVTPQHTVLVDNGNDFPVEVEVGSKKITMAPRSVASVPAWSGDVTVSAKGAGWSEQYTLEMPDVGWSAGARTALYNVNGKSQLALVRMTYGTVTGKDDAPVTAVPRKDRFTLLPQAVSGTIDEAFPEKVKTKGWGVAITHVCRVERGTGKVGCGV